MVRLSADPRYASYKEFFEEIISADQSTQLGIELQRERIERVKSYPYRAGLS